MPAVNPSPFDAPQLSEEWFALRKDKLTTSTFSAALGFWKGKHRSALWHGKVFASETKVSESSNRCATEWGVLNERAAIEKYRSITGHEVTSLGFAIHSKEQCNWLGASLDGLLGSFPGGGILEVQGQMEIMDREWADLYCWTPIGSTIFRVHRDCCYWDLIHGILHEFWWGNVLPAREAVLLGKEEDAKTYEPTPTHKKTGLAISQSTKLASEAKMLCREIAGTGSLEFLEDISSGLSYLANKELVMLRELKVEQLEFDLDLGALKQYFPVNLVPSGIFKISLDVFGKSLHAYGGLCRLHFPAGLRFEETADAEAWHCDLEKNGLSLWNREGKYGQTCVVLQNGSVAFNGAQQNDIGGVPSLLRFSEVASLLHEFGHVAQHMCNRAPLARFSGQRVSKFSYSFTNYGAACCSRIWSEVDWFNPVLACFLSCHHLAQLTSAADSGKKSLQGFLP
ncbi:hypothetical protein V6N11_075172 [Hibiscus sabdariffa]|uniref:Uncharacterized protein n=1 Tax=Hibiscus sabdariffa TaxID=183260 RepID=A0ABR2R610_9ROSI